MKKFKLFFFLIIISLSFQTFGQYHVRLRIDKITNPESIYHPGEWAVLLYADIFDNNNNLIPHSSNYYYTWYKDECTAQGEVQWAEGYDLYTIGPDGHNSTPDPSYCDRSLTF